MIMLAIEDYHNKTAIRFKKYNPQTDSDHVHITGEDTGCWSYVGRLGGVSSRVQDVVRTSPTLRNAPVGLRTFTTNTQIHPDLSHVIPHPQPPALIYEPS